MPHTKKKKWRILEQREQVDVDEVLATQGMWNKNYSTLSSFRAEVEEVLRDQAGRGQVLILPEVEARNRFPNLVVASLGAQRKEKVVILSYTDNSGNGALLNKLMSSKYPRSALLMEFGEQLRHSGVRPDV